MGYPVRLNVYDVTNTSALKGVNNVTQGLFKSGGVFHAAVEIHGKEWSFGFTESGTGIFDCEPRECDMHQYRETIDMGETEKNEEEIEDLIDSLLDLWPGDSYSLLSRNCCTFTEEFCAMLGPGVKKYPAWVNRYAKIADQAAIAAKGKVKQIDERFKITHRTGQLYNKIAQTVKTAAQPK